MKTYGIDIALRPNERQVVDDLVKPALVLLLKQAGITVDFKTDGLKQEYLRIDISGNFPS